MVKTSESDFTEMGKGPEKTLECVSKQLHRIGEETKEENYNVCVRSP